ncbi:MAG TPA: haloacid dehalogenase-like hydrolase [Rubrivivax sp.]|nr:haloacid dehalogenase-like hydrolase [Rubrivivax sp.]
MKNDPSTEVKAGPLSSAGAASSGEPLPSWNNGPAKQSILSFVAKVTTEGSPSFVPVPERIATFDNDGTLWCEQPVPVQVYFARDRVNALAPQHPEWETQEPFASLLRGDLRATLAAGEAALLEIVMATHAGMSTVEFGRIVEDWIATAKHPQTGRLFTEMVYQPMLEVLAYLRANGFKNYIVTGGGIEFLRQWGERVYGVPPEQVIGSSIETRFEMRDGKPVLMRLPKLSFNNDKADKPVAINQHIGRCPVAAFGNSVGDQHMLEYTQGGGGARFGLLVLHDDAAREYAYGPALGLPTPQLGAFTPALHEQALRTGWPVVSMKDDWQRVFPFEAGPVTAINILLEPDATMLQRCEANNAQLLKVFPKGFALDASHRPHVTLLQRFVRTVDLDKIYAAAGKVFAGTDVLGLRMEAFKYYYIPSGAIGLAGMVARQSPELRALQRDLIEAVAPFTVTTGGSDAFATTPDDPVIDPLLIDYVSAFVPKSAGEQFSPHVTTGIAPREHLDKMLAEPFESFTFSPAGAAVYQLGQFGTAATKLHDCGLKR